MLQPYMLICMVSLKGHRKYNIYGNYYREIYTVVAPKLQIFTVYFTVLPDPQIFM